VASARGAAPAAAADTDFGKMLMQMSADAANVVRQAEATSVAAIQGKVSVQQVVEGVMAAERTLQGAVAIRDKVVAAYLEISRMQI
jgi:flagellar hook-basal body complex protein FliE